MSPENLTDAPEMAHVLCGVRAVAGVISDRRVQPSLPGRWHVENALLAGGVGLGGPGCDRDSRHSAQALGA